ncbi:ABC transporter ATP-binding protein [Candidatus Solirubrobacter pratensis]|uniref:ABC transporter ATP-binding protein n=1 Tax=Candidatus Solirubrobacter pratensis TaxID=1298857 RepID=UPI0004092E3D|nr:ABC transporter ATP-binding protein [Candidatus Solirubrobacter pratensis]
MSVVLSVRDLSVDYGQLRALSGITFELRRGQTLAVIGANGAGKSTLLGALAGLWAPAEGSVGFNGRDISALPAFVRVGLGIALVPEGRRLFASLTARENLLTGQQRGRSGGWDIAAVVELFPLLEALLDRPSGRLSGGEQQAVAIGRALMGNPELLLLDEVSLGLAPVLVEQLYAALPRIQAAGATVLIVEQDVGQALAVADEVVTLLEGRQVLHGAPSQLRREDIIDAYFGARAA